MQGGEGVKGMHRGLQQTNGLLAWGLEQQAAGEPTGFLKNRGVA